MLNHILGILVGYMLAGYVCTLIDAYTVAKRIRKKLEQEGRVANGAYSTEPDDSQERRNETREQTLSNASIGIFLIFAICWPFLMQGVHEQVVKTYEYIYDTTLD